MTLISWSSFTTKPNTLTIGSPGFHVKYQVLRSNKSIAFNFIPFLLISSIHYGWSSFSSLSCPYHVMVRSSFSPKTGIIIIISFVESFFSQGGNGSVALHLVDSDFSRPPHSGHRQSRRPALRLDDGSRNLQGITSQTTIYCSRV